MIDYKTTEVKEFNGVILSEATFDNFSKYMNAISIFLFMLIIPACCLELLVLSPLLLICLLLCKHECDKLTNIFEIIIRSVSCVFVLVNTFVSFGISLFLTGVIPGIITLQKNWKYIYAMSDSTWYAFLHVDMSDIAEIYRSSIEKEGLFYTWLKLSFMFSILPMIKYVLTSNPILFDFQLCFINQFTKDLSVEKRTVPSMIIIEQNYNENIIDFVPNFVLNNKPERIMTIGMQNYKQTMTYVPIEYIHTGTGQLLLFTYISPISRNSLLQQNIMRFWIDWYNPFHWFTAYSEINITENGSLQRPLAILLSNSYFSELILNSIKQELDFDMEKFISKIDFCEKEKENILLDIIKQ